MQFSQHVEKTMSEKIIPLENWDQTLTVIKSSGEPLIEHFTQHRQTVRQTDRQICIGA